MNKQKKKKQNFKQPDELHEALDIPKYEKIEQNDGTDVKECVECKKKRKKCKC